MTNETPTGSLSPRQFGPHRVSFVDTLGETRIYILFCDDTESGLDAQIDQYINGNYSDVYWRMVPRPAKGEGGLQYCARLVVSPSPPDWSLYPEDVVTG